MSEQNPIQRTIGELLGDVLSNTGDAFAIDAHSGLRAAGVSSAAIIALLVGIEREFHFEWDDDTPAEVFHSISTLAAYVAEHPSARKLA